jgi:hypothetical protein
MSDIESTHGENDSDEEADVDMQDASSAEEESEEAKKTSLQTLLQQKVRAFCASIRVTTLKR